MNKVDHNFRPQDDFFKHINNHWLTNNPIPKDYTSWGTFYEINDAVLNKLRQIIQEVLTTNPSQSELVELKKFIKSSQSYSRFEKNHLLTLQEEIIKILEIKNLDELASYLGYAHALDISAFWGAYVDVDDKDHNAQILRLCQSGLTLPNRDYYLEKENQSYLTSFQDYFQATITNFPLASTIKWTTILNTEKFLAQASCPPEDLRDPQKNYHRFNLKKLQQDWPSFNWKNYFQALGWQATSDLLVDQPQFISDCLTLWQPTSLATLKSYLIWQLLDNTQALVSARFNYLHFKFHGQTLTGKAQPTPVWKKTIFLIRDCGLGNILSKLFVEKYFPEKTKQQVEALTEDIKQAFHQRIDNLTWLGQDSQKVAHQKLDNIKVLIGYPDKWRDYSGLQLVDNDLIENYKRTMLFETQYLIQKIGTKTDQNEWQMEPFEVNAYHDPSRLVICFLAGIIQPPFFDPQADYATNLGGIGAVIGHELTHGFDDMGAQFDALGDFKVWQQPQERATFQQLVDQLIEEANQHEVLPGLKQNGKLIIGEIIADIGGLELALEALKSTPYQPADIKKLITNFAICERGKNRQKNIYRLAKTDPHPISSFRVNFSLSFVDDFYQAYQLQPTDQLFLPSKRRTKIW